MRIFNESGREFMFCNCCAEFCISVAADAGAGSDENSRLNFSPPTRPERRAPRPETLCQCVGVPRGRHAICDACQHARLIQSESRAPERLAGNEEGKRDATHVHCITHRSRAGRSGRLSGRRQTDAAAESKSAPGHTAGRTRAGESGRPRSEALIRRELQRQRWTPGGRIGGLATSQVGGLPNLRRKWPRNRVIQRNPKGGFGRRFWTAHTTECACCLVQTLLFCRGRGGG
jgi:hypothetical protein